MRLSDFSRLMCHLVHVQNFQRNNFCLSGKKLWIKLKSFSFDCVCVDANRDIKSWLADEVFKPLSNRFSSLLENPQKKISFMRTALFFAFPAVWNYGFSSLSHSNYTSPGGVFHWFLSISNLQITAITGFWLQWNDGVVLARLGRGIFCTETLAQPYIRISPHSKGEVTVTASQIWLSFREAFYCLLVKKKNG